MVSCDLPDAIAEQAFAKIESYHCSLANRIYGPQSDSHINRDGLPSDAT